MNRISRLCLMLVAAIGLAFTGINANAQLISGSSQGAFLNPQPAVGNVQVFNPSIGTFATLSSFYTGSAIPGSNSTSQTGVTFFGTLFSPLTLNLSSNRPSGLIAIGYFVFSNGQTIAGTTIDTIDFSSRLDFTASGGPLLNSSPFQIKLDGGHSNSPGFVDNEFTITNPGGGMFSMNGIIYAYGFAFDATSIIIPEAGSGQQSSAVVNLYLNMPPFPEPSTYAFAGVVTLGCVVLVRRFRAKTVKTA